MSASNPLVSVWASPAEHCLLEAAAAHAGTSLGKFVRRKALEAAELELMNGRLVTIPVAGSEKFEAWASAPARDIPELRTLAAARPAWRE